MSPFCMSTAPVPINREAQCSRYAPLQYNAWISVPVQYIETLAQSLHFYCNLAAVKLSTHIAKNTAPGSLCSLCHSWWVVASAVLYEYRDKSLFPTQLQRWVYTTLLLYSRRTSLKPPLPSYFQTLHILYSPWMRETWDVAQCKRWGPATPVSSSWAWTLKRTTVCHLYTYMYNYTSD